MSQTPGIFSRWSRADATAIILTACLCLILLGMVGRVVQLQVAPGERLRGFIQERTSRVTEMAGRGEILDRRGRLLAGATTGQRLFVDPSRFPEPYEQNMLALANAAGLQPTVVGPRLFEAIERSNRRVAQGLTPLTYVRLSGILTDSQLEGLSTVELPGVHLERWGVRDGPGADVAAAVVGRTDVDLKGQFGAERKFDASLRGHDGAITYIRDASGRPLWLEQGGYSPPRSGAPVRLSIDAVMQDIAEEEIEIAVADANAAGGRLVLVDPATGEILALVDHIRDLGAKAVPWKQQPRPGGPSRRTVIPPDPNRFVHPGAGRNRCFTDLYEPGSAFKPFAWAIITDAGVAGLDEVFRTGGKTWRTPYGRPISDVIPKDAQSWREVLINSSNIGMSMGAERISHQRMRSNLAKFGFGQKTGLGIPGEREGRLPQGKAYSKYTHTSVSFGQEIAVTPVQMARAFSVFARQGELAGTLPELRLTAWDPESGEQAPMYRRVIPWRVAAAARLAMIKVFEAADRRMKQRKLDMTFNYVLFGKSGTAEVSIEGERGYVENQYISSFVGAGPAHAPRLVCIVVIDDPGPEMRANGNLHRGSAVAAPVVRRVLERSLAYLGVPPTIAPPQAAAAD